MKNNESPKSKSSTSCLQLIAFFAFSLVVTGIVTTIGLGMYGKAFIDKDSILGIQICIGGLILSTILYIYYRNKED